MNEYGNADSFLKTWHISVVLVGVVKLTLTCTTLTELWCSLKPLPDMKHVHGMRGNVPQQLWCWSTPRTSQCTAHSLTCCKITAHQYITPHIKHHTNAFTGNISKFKCKSFAEWKTIHILNLVSPLKSFTGSWMHLGNSQNILAISHFNEHGGSRWVWMRSSGYSLQPCKQKIIWWTTLLL
jgi:hypothetical protein